MNNKLRIISLTLAIAMLVFGIGMCLGFFAFANHLNESESDAATVGLVFLTILFFPFIILYTLLSIIPLVLSAIQLKKSKDGLSIANVVFHLIFAVFFAFLCVTILAPPTYISLYTAMFFVGLALSVASGIIDVQLLVNRRRAKRQ